ncbi:MAG: GNAT family N-acetyltransferase [Cryomorphaceae bacterium]|jgi:ribosomal-protein-alanine N-acetyltransferase|nr:GNAT family N-acetyltransferase [Cryomorphaceae bacterium]
MILRKYEPKDKEKCVEIFQSNFPKFFDKSELSLFINWLDHQVGKGSTYQSPTYTNSEKDAYFVVEHPETGIIGCGGFYIVKDKNEARLAWGMIHSNFHKQGYGKALYNYRKEIISKEWPKHLMVLGTSQHTYSFYEKMGMTITAKIKAGYGPDLDKYDMTQ